MTIPFPSRSLRSGKILLTGAGLLLALTAQAGQANAPVLLRLKFKLNDITKYQTTMHVSTAMNMPHEPPHKPVTSAISIRQQQKVIKLMPNNCAEVQTTTQNIQVVFNGQAKKSPPMPIISKVMSSQNRILATQGQAVTSPMQLLSGALNNNSFTNLGAFLPPKAAKPGDTWTDPMLLPGMTGKGTAKSRFLRYEKWGNYQTARIRSQITLPVNLMMDSLGHITTQPAMALMVATGTVTLTMESNFTLTDTKMVHTDGQGIYSVTMKPIAPPQKGQPGSPISMSNVPINISMTMNMDVVP